MKQAAGDGSPARFTRVKGTRITDHHEFLQPFSFGWRGEFEQAGGTQLAERNEGLPQLPVAGQARPPSLPAR